MESIYLTYIDMRQITKKFDEDVVNEVDKYLNYTHNRKVVNPRQFIQLIFDQKHTLPS